jgi:2-amino-4-hydroxy-6-hydroxymethyldihydropteridine diphosphokinase
MNTMPAESLSADRPLDPAAAGPAFIRAVLALGSNLGERHDTLSAAVAELVDRPEVRLRDVSPVVQTKPVGGPAGQPDFLNMVMEIETGLDPYQLLAHCHEVEARHQRTREVRWGARTLDVDIITYGDLVNEDEELTLPHPRAAGRAFVLYPWSVMDPHATLAGKPVSELAVGAADMAGIAHFEGFEADTGARLRSVEG